MYREILKKLASGEDVRAQLIGLKEYIKEKGVDAIKSAPEYNKNIFEGLLSSEDAKVRKNTALIMGELKEAGFEHLLFSAYKNEQTLFVKASYLQALSKLDYGEFREKLEVVRSDLLQGEHGDDIKHVAEEIKALNAMLGTENVSGHTFKNPIHPVDVVLTTGKDTIDTLCEYLNEQGYEPQRVFCGALVHTRDISEIINIRLYRDMLFPLNAMKSFEKNELAAEIMAGNLMPLLDALHDGDGAYRFRITGKNIQISDLAGRLVALSKGRLVNAPSDYEIEIKLIPGRDGRVGAFLKLHTCRDYRFNYRREYVAASIKPVNAAMAVYLARNYLKPDAQVLDPFCGVGTMLIERNEFLKAPHMYGIDIYGPAIEGARTNTQIARCQINYIHRDYFEFAHDYLFDEIITNMPVLSHDEVDDLYHRFFEKSRTHLKNRGIMILYSGEKNIIKKYLRLLPEYKLLREFPMNSREGTGVFVIEYTDKRI